MIRSIVKCFRGLIVFCLTSFLHVCVYSSVQNHFFFSFRLCYRKQLVSVALSCCTGIKYLETMRFLSLTKHVKRESWRKSWCTHCYFVSFSLLQSGAKQLFSIWINFGCFGMRHVPEILKRERRVAEWRFLAASLCLCGTLK